MRSLGMQLQSKDHGSCVFRLQWQSWSECGGGGRSCRFGCLDEELKVVYWSGALLRRYLGNNLSFGAYLVNKIPFVVV